MIPRLEAAEKLGGIEVAALGAPTTPEAMADRQQAIEALADRASGTVRKPAAPAPANPDDLAGMGIAIRAGDQPVIGDLQAWLGNDEPEAQTNG